MFLSIILNKENCIFILWNLFGARGSKFKVQCGDNAQLSENCIHSNTHNNRICFPHSYTLNIVVVDCDYIVIRACAWQNNET